MQQAIVPLSTTQRDAALARLDARLSAMPREDEEKRNQQLKSDRIVLNGIYLGVSSVSDKMGNLLVAKLSDETVENAFVENGEICIEADMRTAAEKKTKAGKTDLATFPIYEASKIVGEHAPEHPYKRARIRIREYTTYRVFLTGAPPEARTLARCSISASAFYGKEDHVIGVMIRLEEATPLVTFLPTDFVYWAHRARVATPWFVTRVFEYSKALEAALKKVNNKLADVPKKVKDAANYRDDNVVQILLGFDADPDATARLLMQPTGVYLCDKTRSDTTSAFTNYSADLQKEVPRYQAEIHGIQWRDTNQGFVGEPSDSRKVVKFIINMTLWPRDVATLTQINYVPAWKDLAVCMMPHAQIFVLGQERAEESKKNMLTESRWREVQEDINESTGSDKISFVVCINPSTIISDPISGLLRRVGIPVTAQGVRAIFNGTTPNSPAPTKDFQPAAKLDFKNQPFLCVTESREDVARILADPDVAQKWEFRVVTNAVGTEPGFDPVQTYGKIKKPEEGDRLATYFADVLLKDRKQTREQFCADKKWTPTAGEALMLPGGYVFRGTGKWLYVYFINLAYVKESRETFYGEVETLMEKVRTGKGTALPVEFKELLALPEPAAKRGRDEDDDEEEETTLMPPSAKKGRVEEVMDADS